MFGSSRSGGVRGGQDQFNWDDVKVDKHRENYLGKSWGKIWQLAKLLALTGDNANSCLLTCNHHAKSQLKLHSMVSVLHLLHFHTFCFTVPHYTVSGCSVLVLFSTLQSAGPSFHCSLCLSTHTHVATPLSEHTPLAACQHAKQELRSTAVT